MLGSVGSEMSVLIVAVLAGVSVFPAVLIEKKLRSCSPSGELNGVVKVMSAEPSQL